MLFHSGKAEKSAKADRGQLVSVFFYFIVSFKSWKADHEAVTNRWSPSQPQPCHICVNEKKKRASQRGDGTFVMEDTLYLAGYPDLQKLRTSSGIIPPFFRDLHLNFWRLPFSEACMSAKIQQPLVLQHECSLLSMVKKISTITVAPNKRLRGLDM